MLIFVRHPRGHLWDKTYFAYVVKFVRIVLFGHRELLLAMHTWLFLYAAMMQDIITIFKINLRGKCFFSPAKKVSILPLSRNSLSEPYGIMVSGTFAHKLFQGLFSRDNYAQKQ